MNVLAEAQREITGNSSHVVGQLWTRAMILNENQGRPMQLGAPRLFWVIKVIRNIIFINETLIISSLKREIQGNWDRVKKMFLRDVK